MLIDFKCKSTRIATNIEWWNCSGWKIIKSNKMNISQRTLLEKLESKEWHRNDFISLLENETRKTEKVSDWHYKIKQEKIL